MDLFSTLYLQKAITASISSGRAPLHISNSRSTIASGVILFVKSFLSGSFVTPHDVYKSQRSQNPFFSGIDS